MWDFVRYVCGFQDGMHWRDDYKTKINNGINFFLLATNKKTPIHIKKDIR